MRGYMGTDACGNVDDADRDDDLDICPHGVGFDEYCEDCDEDEEGEEMAAELEEYEYSCNACGANEAYSNYRSSFVCPWCGEGVMRVQE